MFIAGFLVWIVFAIVAGFAVWGWYRTEGTSRGLTFTFAFFGAMIGGMLGVAAYIFHNPSPLRLGGIIGAAAGALFFSALYQFVARKAV
jgi:uncharacterized membrane protein YeaQ/YmgE (transglycosylase-associated protein family)